MADFNRFDTTQATIDIRRSVFKLEHNHKTTFNTGDLVPIAVLEILPGDTFSVNTAMVIRTSTPIKPVMDNSFVDTHWFFVPNRIVWDNWKRFMGENVDAPWTSQYQGQVPTMLGVVGEQSLADYLGVPPIAGNGNGSYTQKDQINALPFRAYQLIYNEWYRDQNLQQPLLINKGDNIDDLSNGTTATLRKADKFPDYFTKALPAPQKGQAVQLGLVGNAIVKQATTGTGVPVRPIATSTATYRGVALSPGGSQFVNEINGAYPDTNRNFATLAVQTEPMVADLSTASSATINQLRLAITLQQYLELDARAGTRYQEYVLAHFKVMSDDARQQRPEFLGGNRIPLSMAQVPQTSNTVSTVTPQGNLAAYSHSADQSSSFTKSFTEHGYVLGIAVHRTKHTYQQGIPRHYNRKTKYDFYDPLFANIGEQAILNREIYVRTEATTKNNEVFGYIPAWEEYKQIPDRISGQFRSKNSKTLDIWHYGDNYSALPVLGADWIQEPVQNMDRTLAVSSTQANQLIADIQFDITATRAMPTMGIPGLYRL